MSTITLTIDGQQVSGNEGDTILDICNASGIDIPTLCHFQGLSNSGACRLCVVEVEKERKPVPSCMYPARDGLVVHTNTEKLEKYRRLILELLFTERNHPCAYCVASGNCELQNLAYRYQMDNVRYSYSYPNLKVDAVSDYLVIDHNRCVLCGRCIRMCDEIAGIHTLDFGNRGWKNTICADLNKSLGESSCISCGACLQACPTGAISSKFGVYQVKPHEEYDTVRSICPVCGVGCEIEATVKENRIVKIESPDLMAERGILCYKGRFSEVARDHSRISSPLIKDENGNLTQCSLADASEAANSRMKAIKQRYGASSIIGLASSQASDETLERFNAMLRDSIGTDLIDTFDGDDYRLIMKAHAAAGSTSPDQESTLEDITRADCIVIAGADPFETNPVVGSYILRAVKHNNASLIVIDSEKNPFSFNTSVWLKPQKNRYKPVLNALLKAIADNRELKGAQQKKIATSVEEVDIARSAKDAGIESTELNKAALLIAQSTHPMVIYGERILSLQAPDVLASIINLAGICGDKKGTIVSLKRHGNSMGAWKMGIAHPEQSVISYLGNKSSVKVAYILLAEEYCDNADLIDGLKKLDCVIVEASYQSPLTAIAHIVLPCPTWMESSGTYTTLDNITKVTSPIIRSAVGATPGG